MTYVVRFALAARDQLAEIEDYISRASSPIVAARYVDSIVVFCESLATFPLRGRKRDDLLPGLRITNYRRRAVIAFLVDTKARIVSIVGVFYGGQDYETFLQDDVDDTGTSP